MQYVITKSELENRADCELETLNAMFHRALMRTEPCSPERRMILATVENVQDALNARRARMRLAM